MIIGINILYLIPNKVGGTEYYARSLLSELEQQDQSNSYVIFCNEECARTLYFSSPNWKIIVCPVQARNRVHRVLFEQLILPRLAKKENCDILHSLGYTSPFHTHCPQITTIHDANWKDTPQDMSMLEKLALNILISGSIQSARFIITDSIFASERIQYAYPNAKEKIKIVQPGIDSKFLRLIHRKDLIKGKKYLLCVSGFYPHINIPYLLHLWRNLQSSLTDFKLILVGQNGRDEQQVKNMIHGMKSVEWHTKVSLDELASFYKSASAFIFPSIYEGFGFPVYEALAAQLPVFVGSKKPFQEISKELFKLTFNIQKDTQLILQNLDSRPRTPINLPGYEQTANKLLSIYQECIR